MMRLNFEDIGKVFDEIPHICHSMKRVRMHNSQFDSVKLGYLIFADSQYPPNYYYVFQRIGNDGKVLFTGICKYLKHVDRLIRYKWKREDCIRAWTGFDKIKDTMNEDIT